MIHEIGQWLDHHLLIPGLPVWANVIVIAVAMAAISIGITIVALIAIPADYFRKLDRPARERYQHPILRWGLRIFKNVVGWFLIILGIVLSFPGVPGQGLLTILLGVMLAEFPGKSRLEQKLIHMDRIRNAINRLRMRFGKDPLQIDDPD